MSEETTRALVGAARRAFARDGYAGTSMDALCADAGVTRGALYHHFGGKDGLLEAVVRDIDAELGAAFDAEEARHDDPWEGLLACCRLWLERSLEPEIQRVLLRDAPAVLGQRFRDMDESMSIVPLRDALASLMETRRVRAADPEALARLVNGALVDAALWVASSDDPDDALERALGATGTLLSGLAAGSGS